MGTSNFCAVRSRSAISAPIPLGRRSMDHGDEHQSAGRLLLERQNGFVGLLQKGESHHITLNIRNKPNKNNVPKPITKISSAFSKSRPISIITQDPSKYLPKRRLFERQKKKNLNSIIDSRTHRTDYDGGLY